MNYTDLNEISDSDSGGIGYGTVDESLQSLIQEVKTYFEPDYESVEVPLDDKYLKCFGEFKEEYTNEMQNYLKILKKFEEKQTMADTLLGFSITMGSKSDGKYVDKIKDIINEFIESEKLDELKKELQNSQEIIRKFYKISSIAKDLSMNNEYFCFICLERGIDTMIEPCGHVICESCSKGAIQQCPFCRANISSFKRLLIA